jgi:arsenical pump membrane protein
MFTIILALQANSVTSVISKFLGNDNVVFKYGTISFLSANLINNIPMSVFFCSVISPLQGTAQIQAIYATIAGSNLGAILTPIGALAGIMWSSLLKNHQVKFSYLSFIKYGVIISIPSLAVNLLSLILFI